MGCHEKFCIIRRPDGQKHYYGVVIRKLLYKIIFFARPLGGGRGAAPLLVYASVVYIHSYA